MNTETVVVRPRRRIRIALAALTLVIVISTVAGVPILFNVTAVGAGYFAKQLCSEVFVAGRVAQTVVETDLRYFFPRLLMWVARWATDADRGTARASFFGIGTRVARFQGDAGCVLEPVNGNIDAPPGRQAAVARPMRSPALTPRLPLPRPWAVAQGRNEKLDAILDRAFIETDEDPSAQRRTRAIFIVHDGKVIAERYAEGFGEASRFPGWSIAKSLVHAMVGMQVVAGRLKLDGTLPLPEWRHDNRRDITWDQMLRMTSGLAFDEKYANPFSDINQMLWNSADIGKFAATMQLAAPPGTTWRYTSGTSNILTHAMRTFVADGNGNEGTMPASVLFERLGMTSALIERDAAGNLVGSSFVYATAADYARFGWLYAMDGVWEGEAVLPAGWLQHAMQPTAGSDGRYGAHFWLSAPSEDQHYFKGEVPSMLHASGFGGQWITILPAERLVIVRLGQTLSRTAWNHWGFVAAVREALAR